MVVTAGATYRERLGGFGKSVDAVVDNVVRDTEETAADGQKAGGGEWRLEAFGGRELIAGNLLALDAFLGSADDVVSSLPLERP